MERSLTNEEIEDLLQASDSEYYGSSSDEEDSPMPLSTLIENTATPFAAASSSTTAVSENRAGSAATRSYPKKIVTDADYNQSSDDEYSSDEENSTATPAAMSTTRSTSNATKRSCPQPSNQDIYFQSWTKISNDQVKKVKGVKQWTTEPKVFGIEDLSPYEVFLTQFPREIFDHVADETNRYFHQMLPKKMPLRPRSRLHNWKNVTAQQIKAFVAVEICMGLIKKPTLASYFKDPHFMTKTPGFRRVFTEEKYSLIRSAIHFCNNEASNENDDRLFKIRPIIDILKGRPSTIFKPGRNLSVDEIMRKFKGRLFWKQYMPKKPNKWGIKLFGLADPDVGFLLDSDVYTGKDTLPDVAGGLSSKVVQKLLGPYENKGHHVFMDNWFSGIPLFQDLIEKEIGACGTVRQNRKYLPNDLGASKARKGDHPQFWINQNQTFISCSWKDTGFVYMISTIEDTSVKHMVVNDKSSPTGTRTQIKPNINVEYIKNMNGVDVFDHLCSTYPFDCKNMKW